MKKAKAYTTAYYIPNMQKIHEPLSEEIESVCGSASSEILSNLTEDLKASDIVTSLKEWQPSREDYDSNNFCTHLESSKDGGKARMSPRIAV